MKLAQQLRLSYINISRYKCMCNQVRSQFVNIYISVHVNSWSAARFQEIWSAILDDAILDIFH